MKGIKFFKIILINIIFSLYFTSFLFSKEFNGKARVIDGDTIKIKNVNIRLFGIDAPEIKQSCKKIYLSISIFNFQKEYDCGKVSKKALSKKIQNKEIRCVSSTKDRYGRHIGICYLKDRDINKWLVRNGYAVAYKKYSKKYVFEEKYANENKLGLWRGSFMRPEKWRGISN